MTQEVEAELGDALRKSGVFAVVSPLGAFQPEQRWAGRSCKFLKDKDAVKKLYRLSLSDIDAACSEQAVFSEPRSLLEEPVVS